MAGKVTRTVEERFWEKVDRRGRCWNWRSHSNAKGYGLFWLGSRNEFAHRVAWTLSWGPIKNNLRVLHKCDNTSCVRPSHLFLGTLQDNIKDRDEKGRTAKGEKDGNSKLTEAKVKAIRRSKLSSPALAAQYKIDRTQVWNIKTRRQWRHI